MTKVEYLLTKMSEECHELGQRACKAITFGLSEVQPGQPHDNKRRMEQELADLMEVADQLGLVIRDEDKTAKRIKMAKFMGYSQQLGTLEADKS